MGAAPGPAEVEGRPGRAVLASTRSAKASHLSANRSHSAASLRVTRPTAIARQYAALSRRRAGVFIVSKVARTLSNEKPRSA